MDAETKQFLEAMERRADQRQRELSSSVEVRIQQLREYIDERINDAEKRLREYIDERLRDVENRLREYIDERTHDSETRIVRAFGAYQESAGVRMRKIEADVSNVNASTTQQLDAVQSKLLDLETRIINLEGPQGRTA
jgi:hypothetical protein